MQIVVLHGCNKFFLVCLVESCTAKVMIYYVFM
jgi:hypothetical protein